MTTNKAQEDKAQKIIDKWKDIIRYSEHPDALTDKPIIKLIVEALAAAEMDAVELCSRIQKAGLDIDRFFASNEKMKNNCLKLIEDIEAIQAGKDER